MKTCPQCRQHNSDDAKFCHQCGTAMELQAEAASAPHPSAPVTEEELWRRFIGPNADRYLTTFKKFSTPSGPRFALSWHWPTFIFEPFLWFLYRKMYVYAMIYAVGPVIAFYLTQDLSADIVWRLMAGVSANYIYFWHVKEQVSRIKTHPVTDGETRGHMLGDLGGVQPYVVWVGVGLFVLKVALVVTILKEGPPEGSDKDRPKIKPAGVTAV